MKRTIKLNKTELNNLIAESVRRTLKEWNNKNLQNLPYVNETREKADKLTNKILAEVTTKLKGNKPTSSLNESANTRYKGFKCVNTSNDPSFPTYAIISPQGEQIGTTLFPSEMKEIVDEYLNGNQ